MKKIGKKKRGVSNPKRFIVPEIAPEIFVPKEKPVEVEQPQQVPVELPQRESWQLPGS